MTNMKKENDDVKARTRRTAELFFHGYPGELAYNLWREFDKDLTREMSLFITGQLYSRERIPHPVRQLCTVAALTVLERTDELKMHIHAALNVGCTPGEVAEVIFQMLTYGGVPVANTGLKTLREVLQQRDQWPIQEE